MKDIIKIMKFDYRVSAATAIPATVFTIILVSLICLFTFPGGSSYIMFVAMVFVIPLQGAADKNDFNKLYGILPVKRENITRARFAFIFLSHFALEVIALIMAVISILLKLYRYLPESASVLFEVSKTTFSFSSFMNFGMCVGVMTVFCTMFLYMEMMGQIFGRENEMKILLVTLGIAIAILFGYGTVSIAGYLPMINFDAITEISTAKCIVISVCCNVLVAVMCFVFGEITTKAVSKREL